MFPIDRGSYIEVSRVLLIASSPLYTCGQRLIDPSGTENPNKQIAPLGIKLSIKQRYCHGFR